MTTQTLIPLMTISLVAVILYGTGWRVYYEHASIDQYAGMWLAADDTIRYDMQHSVRILIAWWCLAGVQIVKNYDHGAAGSVTIILANRGVGIWRDPYRTPGHPDHNIDKS
jgi:hypothetical protein